MHMLIDLKSHIIFLNFFDANEKFYNSESISFCFLDRLCSCGLGVYGNIVA